MGGSNHYSKHQINLNRCRSQCPLHRGCPLVEGSIIGGSTVHNYNIVHNIVHNLPLSR